MARALHIAGVALLMVAGLVACADDGSRRTTPGGQAPTSATSSPSRTLSIAPATPSGPPEREREPVPEPKRSYVTIPALGLRDFPVVRYQGSPDDGPGTAIQNAGEMASPRGPRGGVGPGEIGNFIVTGHRLTGRAPLRYSPSLQDGARILVRSGDTVHVYEVRRTRWTSFRQPSSLAAQRAPVPGRPGLEPTRAYLTLSTCATIEDHSAGNYWSDQYDNPEHRIDKIAVLVGSRPA
jgi:sortase A